MNPVIRPAAVADAAAISRLIVDLAGYYVEDPAAAEVQPFFEAMAPAATAERIAAPNYRFFVVDDAAGLCGVVAMRDGSHLYHLFVRADAHGRGLARALWQHARADSGRDAFTVNASLYAVPMYERFGFVATSPPRRENGLVFVPMVCGAQR